MTNKNHLQRPRSLGRNVNFAASASMAMCNQMLEPHDLTLPQWVLLSALWQKEPLTVGDIAAYSGNNVPATSRLLDRMVDKGLVSRKPDATDRRTIRVGLTKKGAALRHLDRFFETVNARMTDGLTPDEVDRLFDLLERVDQNCRRHMSDTD